MIQRNKRLYSNIKSLSPREKLELVDYIIQDLDKPNPDIERAWAKEAERRLKSIKSGKTKTISYSAAMKRLRQKG